MCFIQRSSKLGCRQTALRSARGALQDQPPPLLLPCQVFGLGDDNSKLMNAGNGLESANAVTPSTLVKCARKLGCRQTALHSARGALKHEAEQTPAPSASLSGPSDHEDVTGVSSTMRRTDEVTPCGAVRRGRRGHKHTATQTIVDSPATEEVSCKGRMPPPVMVLTPTRSPFTRSAKNRHNRQNSAHGYYKTILLHFYSHVRCSGWVTTTQS